MTGREYRKVMKEKELELVTEVAKRKAKEELLRFELSAHQETKKSLKLTKIITAVTSLIVAIESLVLVLERVL